MHVTFISQCEKRALKRTRTLLDRYAIRAASDTWMTPITLEALNDVRVALRKTATRQTAVACYANHGRREMRLLWVVGKADRFGSRGECAIGTQRRSTFILPPWVRVASLVVKAAGLAHDLGKGSQHFQYKLAQACSGNDKPIKDSTRHEWLSMKLYQAMRRTNSFDWKTSWEHIKADKKRHELTFKNPQNHYRPIDNGLAATDFIVLTHHGLLAPVKLKGQVCGDPPSRDKHTCRDQGEGTEETLFTPAGELQAYVLQQLAKSTERVQQAAVDRPNDPHYWRGITLIARAALIWADHQVSALIKNNAKSSLAANTSLIASKTTLVRKTKQSLTTKQLNQSLEWHLTNVAQTAQTFLHHFAAPELGGLTTQTRDLILQPSSLERFHWQDQAATHLSSQAESSSLPTLVFNLAGTGSGKTRMNVKALAALRDEAEPLRIAAGFNLRTLTLQTHRVFQTQFQMGDDEVACVIGDRFTEKYYKASIPTDEDEESELEQLTVGGQSYQPEWLEQLTRAHPELTDLIGAPVLVSTMDYVVKAGEPNQQGHHVHALLRIASSDLILDEVDSYDPKAIIAVARVVQMAGLFGRNIIASSATLAKPVAHALLEAYRTGISMYAALNNKRNACRISFIDDKLAPESHLIDPTTTDLIQSYHARLMRQMDMIQQDPIYRQPFFQVVQRPDADTSVMDCFYQAIREAIDTLHPHQAWSLQGKSVSFGLVRVANVKTCVEIARRLHTEAHIHVTAYHAVDVRLRRFQKEQALDTLFYRSSGNQALIQDPDIRQRIEQTPSEQVIFIVVATPVEEVGRDHDFDWAVIEPSSVQSMVQLAGRVNRHRLLAIHAPNIAILQYNLRALKDDKLAFYRPGNESSEHLYPTHDAHELLETLPTKLDASLRFGQQDKQCRFARWDDESLTRALKDPLHVINVDETKPLTWTTQCHYDTYPLREKNKKSLFRFKLSETDSIITQHWQGTNFKQSEWMDFPLKLYSKAPSKPYWLAPSIADLLADDRALHDSDAMSFEVNDYNTASPQDIEHIIFDVYLGGY